MAKKIRIKQPKPKKASAKKEQAQHAKPTSKKPFQTDDEKITGQREHMDALKASSHWATATDVQSAASAWAATTDQMDTNGKQIAKLHSDLATATSLQTTLRMKWLSGRKHTITSVGVFASGDPTIITDLAFTVLTRAAVGSEITVPTGIVTSPGTVQGEVLFAWDEGSNRHGFMVQHATNPADPTTYSATIPCTAPSFTLDGQTPGAVVHIRVASIDPALKSHVTDWSPWVAGTAAH
jgi:hypothetical protein